MDYLLKSSVEQKEEKDGYYVSRETAEAFLSNEGKIYKNALIGLSFIILAYIPYLLFKDKFETYVIIISIMVTLGVGFFIKAIMLEDNYKILKKQSLLFDENVLRYLNEKYSVIKNKYSILIGGGVCLICFGLVIFFFLKKGLISEVNNAGYQIICTLLVSIGIFISGYFSSTIEAYEILVKNDEYTNKLSFKLDKKIQNKIRNM